ncbi:MAG: Yip1 family protein [Planctomycetota bacterium]
MEELLNSGPDAAIRPWPGIFRHPRRAMRAAADGRHWGALVFLILVGGAVWLLRDRTGADVTPETGIDLTSSQEWALRLVAWVLIPGLAVFLPWVFGRMVGGRATLLEVLLVMLWAGVPALVFQLPLEIVSVMAFGADDPRIHAGILEPQTVLALPPLALVLYLAELAIDLWAMGLLVVGLSEVHRIPTLRALFVAILPLFLMGLLGAIASALLMFALSKAGA